MFGPMHGLAAQMWDSLPAHPLRSSVATCTQGNEHKQNHTCLLDAQWGHWLAGICVFDDGRRCSMEICVDIKVTLPAEVQAARSKPPQLPHDPAFWKKGWLALIASCRVLSCGTCGVYRRLQSSFPQQLPHMSIKPSARAAACRTFSIMSK